MKIGIYEKHTLYLAFLIVLFSGCRNSTNISLGGQYKLITSARHTDLVIVKENHIVVVKNHILDYAFDSIFIIASQRPRDSVDAITAIKYPEYEAIFQNSNFQQYWIIDKSKECTWDVYTRTYLNVFGPFKKQEYLAKRKEIGVPDMLQLKSLNN